MGVVFDKISTRDAFGSALSELAREDENIMYLSADTINSVGGSLMHSEYPNRAINVGIAEQNMALMAAGMAASGAKVFIATYAVFASMRICEQVRTFIAYPNLDVKIVAGLGGLSGGIEGVTHQGTEDIAIMRAIPNMCVVAAADAASTKVITKAIAHYDGPVYLRLGRGPSPAVFDENYEFEFGRANVIRSYGNDVTFFSYGATINRCLQASEMLNKEGIYCRVIETPSLKPFDTEMVLKSVNETSLLVTVEDHNIIGGLGSAVAEALCGKNLTTPCLNIGLNDHYGVSGECEELLDYYGMSAESIVQKVKAKLK